VPDAQGCGINNVVIERKIDSTMIYGIATFHFTLVTTFSDVLANHFSPFNVLKVSSLIYIRLSVFLYFITACPNENYKYKEEI
jgi:hypothetical protein